MLRNLTYFLAVLLLATACQDDLSILAKYKIGETQSSSGLNENVSVSRTANSLVKVIATPTIAPSQPSAPPNKVQKQQPTSTVKLPTTSVALISTMNNEERLKQIKKYVQTYRWWEKKMVFASDCSIYALRNGIQKITLDGTVVNFAGTEDKGFQKNFPGYINTTGQFLTVDNADNLYTITQRTLTDVMPTKILYDIVKINPVGMTTIVATIPDHAIKGIAMDGSNNFYITLESQHTIQKVTSTGEITTYAGNGRAGYADGKVTLAEFRRPLDLVIDIQNNLYVVDDDNNRIRKITPDGMVSTVLDKVSSSRIYLGIDAKNNLVVSTGVARVTPEGLLDKTPYDIAWPCW